MPLGQSEQIAFFTDIDDTLIARNGDPALIRAAHVLRGRLTGMRSLLVLATGTEFGAVKKRLQTGEIPSADAAICAVGTDIWQHSLGHWQRDRDYAALLESTGYRKPEVTLRAARFMRESPRGYGLTFQPHPVGPQKVSLHFMASHTDAAMLAGQARKYFAPFKIIVCEEIHHNATLPADVPKRKFCLDIVPATKADAITYLVNKLGITGGFKAGDSGNDVDMLLYPDNLVPILVGGYKPEAYAAIRAELTDDGGGPLHTLKDGRRIYIETDPNRIAAASLLHAIQTLSDPVGVPGK